MKKYIFMTMLVAASVATLIGKIDDAWLKGAVIQLKNDGTKEDDQILLQHVFKKIENSRQAAAAKGVAGDWIPQGTQRYAEIAAAPNGVQAATIALVQSEVRGVKLGTFLRNQIKDDTEALQVVCPLPGPGS